LVAGISGFFLEAERDHLLQIPIEEPCSKLQGMRSLCIEEEGKKNSR
jgi:hypothetical protein